MVPVLYRGVVTRNFELRISAIRRSLGQATTRLSKGLGETSSERGHRDTVPPRSFAAVTTILMPSPTLPRLWPNQSPTIPFHLHLYPSASPPSLCCFIAWENYRPCRFFVRLHGSSNQNRRRSHRAALGAIRTWTLCLRICVHGRPSTTLRIGFQTPRTPQCGHSHHQCSR